MITKVGPFHSANPIQTHENKKIENNTSVEDIQQIQKFENIEKGMGQCEIDGDDSARPIQIYDNQKHMMKKTWKYKYKNTKLQKYTKGAEQSETDEKSW